MKQLFLAVLLISAATLSAQDYNDLPVPSKKQLDWHETEYYLFMHFGPNTFTGKEWGEGTEQASTFNPEQLDCRQWCRIAKEAGAKAIIITAKHHDGFCLWPTAVSSYNVGNSPFKRDIVGELAQACRRQGITFCVYFTVLDWHDPDYPVKNPHDTSLNVKGDMGRFVMTMKKELKEIVTRYHPFMLWFDGYWDKCWTVEDGKEIYHYLKTLDPRLIINNRLGKGGALSDARSVGDFLTPEQTIGGLNMKEPWESCITICNQWAWKPNDQMKTLKQCIQTLERTAGGNGNLLLNVGPMMDGRMEARQITRLKEMGDWLKKYGESIYGTKGGPYTPNDLFVTTHQGKKIYVHLLEKKTGSLVLPSLPGIRVLKAHFLKGDDLVFTQDPQTGISIRLPDVLPEPISSVIVLEADNEIEP